MECLHFKRGQYIKDKNCNIICKDEIEVVDKLGKNAPISALLVTVAVAVGVMLHSCL